jgi:hypothetical protein
MKNNSVLKQIFNKAKDGDVLGFLAGGIAQYPIPFIAGGDCTHCGRMWNIVRTDSEISFNFSEQTFGGGRFDRVKIILQNGLYYAENYHRLNDSKKVYFSSLKKSLTNEQKAIGIADAISQIGKKYGYLSLILGFRLWEKILPEKLRSKINIFVSHNAKVCSTHIAYSDSLMGLLDFKSDMFYTPMEIINLPYYK